MSMYQGLRPGGLGSMLPGLPSGTVSAPGDVTCRAATCRACCRLWLACRHARGRQQKLASQLCSGCRGDAGGQGAGGPQQRLLPAGTGRSRSCQCSCAQRLQPQHLQPLQGGACCPCGRAPCLQCPLVACRALRPMNGCCTQWQGCIGAQEGSSRTPAALQAIVAATWRLRQQKPLQGSTMR